MRQFGTTPGNPRNNIGALLGKEGGRRSWRKGSQVSLSLAALDHDMVGDPIVVGGRPRSRRPVPVLEGAWSR